MAAKSAKNSKRDRAVTDGESSAVSRLPFEPTHKKSSKKASPEPVVKVKEGAKVEPSEKSVRQSAAIPEVVSRRMGRRMVFYSGIPMGLGMLTLVVSYFVISQHWYKLPHVAVLMVNLLFFGLSVVGLSYGALSASWDEDRLGSWLGWGEFQTNFARLTGSWRSAREKTDS